MSEPRSEHPSVPPVIGPARLAERMREGGDLAVVDVRWYLDGRDGHEAYRSGHLPGAVWADVDTDLSSEPTREGGRHPLPSPEAFAEALGRLGIGDRTEVVAYDDAGGSTAARLVWMLRVLGSPASVLDGGIQAWEGPLEKEELRPEPRVRTAVPWPAERFASTEELKDLKERPAGRVLLDARARGRYTGEQPAPVDARPGHVPGARSAEWQGNLGADGRFAAPERLRERFAVLGVEGAESVTAYCGSGVTACHDLIALEHAGFAGARLYPGSWSAWGADTSLPVETGDPESGTGDAR
ncbi:sulfurtransferase [Nocardiopsis halophila]|uniref:sulfurtransferase n=1 Tax=Nocardiopsis halophila TaxID=141692 RepID=UPI0003448C66|nr:sulfurtransferase [Nocardiopsis halophila]